MLIGFNSLKTFYNALKLKIKNSRGNWEQNDPTADDYIKNRPFYSEGLQEIEILPKVTLELYNGYNEINMTSAFVEGQVYTVIWDNKEYKCLARNAGNDLIYIGNQDVANAIDGWEFPESVISNEPFFIFTFDKFDRLIMVENDGTHSVSITTIQDKVHQIDKKYVPIPDGIVTENDLAYVAFTGNYYDLNDVPDNILYKDDILGKTYADIEFEWDGDSTGKTKIVYNAYPYYKILDITPDYNNISSFKSTRKLTDGSIQEYSGKRNGTNCYSLGYAIVVLAAGSCTLNSMSFSAPEPGIYLQRHDFTSGTTYSNYLKIISTDVLQSELNSSVIGITRSINNIKPDATGNVNISYKGLPDTPEDLLHYGEQSLSKTQQNQARLNIKAIATDDIYGGVETSFIFERSAPGIDESADKFVTAGGTTYYKVSDVVIPYDLVTSFDVAFSNNYPSMSKIRPLAGVGNYCCGTTITSGTFVDEARVYASIESTDAPSPGLYIRPGSSASFVDYVSIKYIRPQAGLYLESEANEYTVNVDDGGILSTKNTNDDSVITFATTSDLDVVSALVGEKPVSEQIDDAIDTTKDELVNNDIVVLTEAQAYADNVGADVISIATTDAQNKVDSLAENVYTKAEVESFMSWGEF